jgi:hypothetical protein
VAVAVQKGNRSGALFSQLAAVVQWPLVTAAPLQREDSPLSMPFGLRLKWATRVNADLVEFRIRMVGQFSRANQTRNVMMVSVNSNYATAGSCIESD